MAPVSAPLSLVPYPDPVALFRTRPEARSEESKSGGQIESVSGSSTVSGFSCIRQTNPLNGGSFYMKHASWWIYIMGGYHSELNGLFYCIDFVGIDPRVLTVARWNRHKVRFLQISCFPIDLKHVIVKRKPVFLIHLEVGTFRCKTAFVTPPKVDHLLSTNSNREKRPKTTNFHWRCYRPPLVQFLLMHRKRRQDLSA